jgi:hypothetical protein
MTHPDLPKLYALANEFKEVGEVVLMSRVMGGGFQKLVIFLDTGNLPGRAVVITPSTGKSG